MRAIGLSLPRRPRDLRKTWFSLRRRRVRGGHIHVPGHVHAGDRAVPATTPARLAKNVVFAASPPRTRRAHPCAWSCSCGRSGFPCHDARATCEKRGFRCVAAAIAAGTSMCLTLGLALLATVAGASEANRAATFSPRLTTPRLAPVPKEGRSEAQVAMLASRPDYNIYKTLAHDTDLYSRWSPLGQFLLNGSSLPPREREIVMLRMGWLCQSEYEWAQHARIAKGEPGLTDVQIHAIAE